MRRSLRSLLAPALAIVAAPAGLRADIGFVVNFGGAAGTGTTVDSFDTFSDAAVAGSPVTVGQGPWDLWGFQGRVYVTCYTDAKVSVIDALNLTAIDAFAGLPSGNPLKNPTGICPHNPNYMAFTDRQAPRARLLFVNTTDFTIRDEIGMNQNFEYPNDIISTGDNVVWWSDGGAINGQWGIWRYDLGAGPPFGNPGPVGTRISDPKFNIPDRMAYNAESKSIYVCNAGGNFVMVVDTQQQAVPFGGQIDVGGHQTDIEVIGDTVYVSMTNGTEVRRFKKSDPGNLLPAITGFTTAIDSLGATSDGYLYVGGGLTSKKVYLVDVTVEPPVILDSFDASDNGYSEFFFFPGGAGTTGAGLGTGITNNNNIITGDTHVDGRSVHHNRGPGGATHRKNHATRKFYNCYLSGTEEGRGLLAGIALVGLLLAALARRRRAA